MWTLSDSEKMVLEALMYDAPIAEDRLLSHLRGRGMPELDAKGSIDRLQSKNQIRWERDGWCKGGVPA